MKVHRTTITRDVLSDDTHDEDATVAVYHRLEIVIDHTNASTYTATYKIDSRIVQPDTYRDVLATLACGKGQRS